MCPTSLTTWWLPQAPVHRILHPKSDSLPPAGSSIAFWALIGFTIILIAAPQQIFPILRPFRIALIFAGVAVSAHLLGDDHNNPQTHTSLELKLVLAIITIAVVGIPISYWPTGSVNTLINQYLKSVTVFWLLGAIVCSVERLRTLLWTLTAASAPLALVGLYNYLSGSLVRNRIVGYDSGLAANPNDLALTLNLFLPFTMMLAVTARRTWLRVIAWINIGFSVAAILVTFSRGGFLTLIAEGALLASLLLRLRHYKAVWILSLVTLLAIVLLPAGYGNRLSTILDIQSDPTGSAQERWRDILAATQFIAAHPLVGAGVGQGILGMNEARGPRWLFVHNAYLNYGVDLGVPGLLLFIALVAATYLSAYRVERLSPSYVGPELVAFAGGARVSVAGFIVAAFFSPVPYHFYFYYIAGITAALKTIGARHLALRSAGTFPPSRPPTP